MWFNYENHYLFRNNLISYLNPAKTYNNLYEYKMQKSYYSHQNINSNKDVILYNLKQNKSNNKNSCVYFLNDAQNQTGINPNPRNSEKPKEKLALCL